MQQNRERSFYSRMLRHFVMISCLAACLSPPEAASVAPTTTTQAVVSDCPPEWCAGNSPQIATVTTWDVRLDHLPNAQAFQLIGMSRENAFYDLDVRESAIVGRDANGNVVLRGSQLQGAILWLQQGAAPDAPQYGIRIAAVGSVPELVPHAPEQGVGTSSIETYDLRSGRAQNTRLPAVVHAGEHWPIPQLFGSNEPVCPVWKPASELSVFTGHPAVPTEGRPSNPAWDDSLTWDESIVLPPFNAVVFEGDRINATTRTVLPQPDDRWFNIGCPRHTLSKMRLTRNTIHTTTGGWQQVQATLKMLSADYCGFGTPLTVAGTPLIWQQNPPGMTYRFPPASGSLEARWDETGARCLETPRIAVHPDPTFRDIWQSIAAECATTKTHKEHRLPRCGNPDPNQPGSEKITTANW